MLGGIAYFAVPWAVRHQTPHMKYELTRGMKVGTTAGLAAIGLESSSIFPTFPRVRFP